MKVLLWTQYFWPENFRINELTQALKENGIEVTVLTGKPNYPEGKVFPGYRVTGVQREQYAGTRVVRVPLVPRGQKSPFRLVCNYLSFIFSGYVFAPFALKGQVYDVVFVYAPSPLLQAIPALFMAKLKKAPLVLWVQDLWPESLEDTGFVKNRRALKLVELVVRYIYQRSDSILIQSEAFRESVARLANDQNKIRYYPNTASSVASKSLSAKVLDIVAQIENTFSVVFAGNIGVAQSIGTLVKAAELLLPEKHIQFFIIGSGSQEEWLQEEIGRLNLTNVKLVGRLPYEEMSAIFSAASVLLVTLKDAKTLSNTVPSKLQAYLSAGKPIVASVNGESARIIREAQAGFVCAAEDWSSLASGILGISQLNAEEYKFLSDNAVEYFNLHFDPAKRVKELIDHFEFVVAQKRMAR
tara:strand:- start:146117 stop:147355 length:1239 start_codon:yes stop_codon:yes gene_type:complete